MGGTQEEDVTPTHEEAKLVGPQLGGAVCIDQS